MKHIIGEFEYESQYWIGQLTSLQRQGVNLSEYSSDIRSAMELDSEEVETWHKTCVHVRQGACPPHVVLNVLVQDILEDMPHPLAGDGWF